jgi:hypothetical protein
MIHRLLVLIACSVLLWTVLLIPAWWCWGDDQLLQSVAALALVALPAVLTLAWISWTYQQTPDMQLMAALGSTGVRMLVALGGGIALGLAFPQTFDVPFWAWLIVLYLCVLALEISILMRPARAAELGAERAEQDRSGAIVRPSVTARE